MDEIEDDARYSSKSYVTDHCNRFRRQKNSLKVSPSSRTTINRHKDYHDDDDLDEFGYGSHVDDECEDEDAGKNGCILNRECDDHLQRHPKRRKVRNSVEGYEFVRRAAPREHNSSPEWTKHAKFALLEAWGDRFLQLRRKSLRSEDWNEVAEKVSEALKIERTELECRTMVDMLKVKYKEEKQKMAETAVYSSRWPYFKKMDMLMAASSRQECGIVYGADSGESMFMNTRVYHDRSNGFDEMRDCPGKSEFSEEDNGSDDFPPRTMKLGWDKEEDSSLRVLADSIHKFGQIFEKIESSKREQMMELERMRLDFYRELEVQKNQILEKAKSEIARLREEDDDDEDDNDGDENDDGERFSDASKENFSG